MDFQKFSDFCKENISIIKDNNVDSDIEYIISCKSGSKIHIKKKNRGSFTRYCGGNVTEDCIRQGKNSSDPRIRKRATFAANARKWHHK